MWVYVLEMAIIRGAMAPLAPPVPAPLILSKIFQPKNENEKIAIYATKRHHDSSKDKYKYLEQLLKKTSIKFSMVQW